MKNNVTLASEFILVWFSLSHETSFCLFLLISIVYVVSIVCNAVIITVVTLNQSLHKPMYIFIGGLSFLELWYPTSTVPKLLWALFTKDKSISFEGCMTQFYFHFSCGTTQNFLLAIMAFDRYVAICHPLRYIVIVSPRTCMNLLLVSWIFSFIIIAIPCLQISSLVLCYNEIDHYYCDFAPLLKLSCSDITAVENIFFAIACFVILGCCFLLIILSYIFILHTMLSLPTSSGRSKAFSTCASHLSVVALFYGTIVFMFVRPTTSDLLSVNKFVSIIPSIVTPVLNPLIYSLRNQEVKHSAKKLLDKLKCQQES
uniref:G-protein coupled receptors family 1 profile domain-containing protein n=1 Tax=Leptobrachium leishanense TaxID=445787 RepID=A0A8C5QD27_9ANUR